jgi:peptide chain release factor 1
VAVLPEVEESELHINENEIRIDVFRSSGPGGQSVNTTDSAVRITHIPTGIVVSCQDEKSQLKNKDKAMRILRARIQEKKEEEAKASSDALKKQMIGSGDRSERIRTYNFPQGRMTDHRINFTSHNLSAIMDGDLDELFNELSLQDRIRRLQESKT